MLLGLIPWGSDPAPAVEAERPTVIVVVGAEGLPEYGAAFTEWAARWQTAAERGAADFHLIGHATEAAETDRETLNSLIKTEATRAQTPLWLVFIGHGTFDGRQAKFNLRGPDLSAMELKGWLDQTERPTAVINCASSSSPFINGLSAQNRVIVTATKSGSEQNFTRFGDHLSQAIIDPDADIDKDGQTSLLEAFLTAARNTEAAYEQQGRLATEHALLDDNGDGLGAGADWFHGVRAVKKANNAQEVDGRRAHQWHLVLSEAERQIPADIRRQRDELELKLQELRDQKAALEPAEYDKRLEELLLQLARLYEGLERTPED